ncbi:MAG: asparagine synthase (glutamine-hydrolyzing) [Deltaproteobacteria bacterium]
MCGIAGWVGGPADRAIGVHMTERLHHRGPDGAGVEVLPDERGVFAHTRLAIIDLSERGRQPFVSDDGRVVLSFNGEIYNFLDLRQRLQQRGFRFRSDCDTEVILAQYLEHGAAGLDALDGMFAFAIYDARDDRLLLMRDRAGKKPLYWTRTSDGALVFGSEVKALAEHPGVTIRPNADALPALLAYGYAPTPTSMFAGIHKLEPASRLTFTRGDVSIHRYWSLDQAAAEATPMSLEDAKTRVRLAVGEAVERRLISDVPLGAFLSGGVDSSIIVAEMAARSSKPVRTFAVGFDDATYDETSYARQIAEQFGADHTELVVSSSPEGLLEKLLDHHDEPYGDSSALATYAVAKATREHVTVALTGDGGDEVFAGYTRFLGGLFSGVVPAPVAKGLYGALAKLPEPRGYKNPVALLRRFLQHGGRSPDEQLLAWNSFFAGDLLTDVLHPDLRAGLSPWSVYDDQLAMFEHERDAGRDRLDQILRHNFRTYLLDDLLVKTDRMTMAASLEARSPFLDTALVELAFRIPGALKMRHGQLKWLLREAYRDVLPAQILDRKKHGFGVPMAKWWSGPLAGLVDDVLLGSKHRWLDPTTVRRIVDEHRTGTRDHAQRIFLMLQIELWLSR